MALHVLFPGTFDPPTLGHLDVVQRAARLFDRVTVALAEHATKTPLFPLDEREALLRECTAGLDRVEVVRLEGLVVDACESLGCDAIVRGVRSGYDHDYEARMAATNRTLLPRIDTLFLPTSPEVAHVTSTLVRQIAGMGGDVSRFVPQPVAAALRERFGRL